MNLSKAEEELVLLFRQTGPQFQTNLVKLLHQAITQNRQGQIGMRQKFVANADNRNPGEDFARNEEEVYALCPWAAEVVPCEGGWQVFESFKDAAIWQNQL